MPSTDKGLAFFARLFCWYRRAEYRLRGYHTVFPVPTDTFNAIVAELAREGFQKRYEYRGVDAWIDYGRLVLEKRGARLVLEWDNWEDGSIEGKPDLLSEIAARHDLEVSGTWRWSPSRET